jgi:hypothetical protein
MAITKFSDGDVRLWVDPNGAVHLRAADSFGDAIELSPDEARELAQALQELADQLDA